MTEANKITLYYKPTCPYSAKVISVAEVLGIDLELKDVRGDDGALNELIEIGGKKQVPFLSDNKNKKFLYESNDIIDYLQTEYGEGKKIKPRLHNSSSVCDS